MAWPSSTLSRVNFNIRLFLNIAIARAEEVSASEPFAYVTRYLWVSYFGWVAIEIADLWYVVYLWVDGYPMFSAETVVDVILVAFLLTLMYVNFNQWHNIDWLWARRRRELMGAKSPIDKLISGLNAIVSEAAIQHRVDQPDYDDIDMGRMLLGQISHAVTHGNNQKTEPL